MTLTRQAADEEPPVQGVVVDDRMVAAPAPGVVTVHHVSPRRPQIRDPERVITGPALGTLTPARRGER